MFRGLALVMIFINHAPGTIYESWTSRNFGFSDAAEAFVLMSGISAGLAYSTSFRTGPLLPAIVRVWARARTLYFVHLVISLLALAIFAAAALWFGVTGPLGTNNIAPLFNEPLGVLVGLPLLTHQLGYFNVLPLYLVLLLVTPFVILIGLRFPWPTLFGAVLLWALAGQFRLNLPNYPNSGGWFFNPLSWQVLFVAGLLSGSAMRAGTAFVPFGRVLFWSALAFVVFVGFWVRNEALAAAGRDVLGHLADVGLPFYITWFDKTFLALPRLLHALALAYVLSSIPQLKQIAESPWAAPLALLGRHGLPVFAVGSVLDMAIQATKSAIGSDPWSDGILLGCGLVALLLLAWMLDQLKRGSARATEPVQSSVLALERP